MFPQSGLSSANPPFDSPGLYASLHQDVLHQQPFFQQAFFQMTSSREVGAVLSFRDLQTREDGQKGISPFSGPIRAELAPGDDGQAGLLRT